VTGLETGAAIAGRFLAPYAAKASLALTRKMRYRWRVDRAVRSRVEVAYSRRQFRAWLKTLSESDLSEPVETAGPQMAIELDRYLGARVPSWRRQPERVSLALRIVEATYLGILKEEDAAVERQLREQWARHRNEDVVTRLVELAGGDAPVSDGDLAVWLRLRSDGRRRTRLAAFGLHPGAVEATMTKISDSLPAVPAGSFRALIGPFGAGKSEIAEEWHLRAVQRFVEDVGTPVPVWIHAREVTAGSLEDAIIRRVGQRLRERGVTVVVDGLDEVDNALAESVAYDARVLVATDIRSAALVTCRPGVLPEADDHLHATPLSEDDARALVESIAGQGHHTWRWTQELMETVRRPFFALAAGTLIAAGEIPTGQADLMTKLVERVLESGSTAATTSSGEVFAVLTTLALSLTRSNGANDGLSFRERKLARSSRLISHDAGDRVTFSLPVFQQWFTAQALLTDDADLLHEALAAPASFDRWRWAIAIAVLGAKPDRTDDLVEACLAMNPGAGAWIIEQVSQGRRPWGDRADPPLDPQVARHRLLRATRCWVNAIGSLAPWIFPVGDADEPIRLGMHVHGHQVQFAWSDAPRASDEAVELARPLSPFQPHNDEWLMLRGGPVLPAEHWPWTWTRDDISNQMLPLLDHASLLGPPGGVWHQEARYRVARAVMRSTSVLHPSLSRTQVIKTGEEMLTLTRSSEAPTKFQLGSKIVTDDQVADLVEWLKGEDFDLIVRPVPVPDLTLPSAGGSAWSVYSPEGLVRFCAEMLGLACTAYEEMADTVFSSFNWSLGHNACRPFGVVGRVHYGTSFGGTPILSFQELPRELLLDEIEADDRLVVSANGKAAVLLDEPPPDDSRLDREANAYFARLTEWAAKTGLDSPFWSLSSGSTIIHSSHDRAASLQAASWMWHDLRRLSLGRGTFPQLGR
jgi:hypothetical protein